LISYSNPWFSFILILNFLFLRNKGFTCRFSQNIKVFNLSGGQKLNVSKRREKFRLDFLPLGTFTFLFLDKLDPNHVNPVILSNISPVVNV